MKSALKKSANPVGQAPAEATQPTRGNTNGPVGGSLLDGKFDEGESHNSFLDALKAFRGEPTTQATTDQSEKSVKFQGDAAANAGKPPAKKNFFANLNNDDFNVNCLPEPPTYAEGATNQPADMKEYVGPKDSCWQCYKLYPRAQPVVCKVSGKRFCKEACLHRYETENILQC